MAPSKKFLTQPKAARILANMKPLQDMLTDWRDVLTLTPAEAARRCKISAQLWYQLESGETTNPRTSTLLRLAEGTGIPMERLAKAAELTKSLDKTHGSLTVATA